MSKSKINLQVVYVIIFVISSIILGLSCPAGSSVGNKSENREQVQELIYGLVESAYAEGQHDALTGDVRIKYINDTTLVWVKSLWDNGRKTTIDTIFVKKKER